MNRLLNILCSCSFLLLLPSCSGPLHPSQSDSLSRVDEGIVQVKEFGLMWQIGRSGKIASVESAENYVAKLSLGGYRDWRLPTKEEYRNLNFSLDFGWIRPKELGMKMNGPFWIRTASGKVTAGEWDSGG